MRSKAFEKKLKELKRLAAEEHMGVFEELSRIETRYLGTGESGDAWARVELARNASRPTASNYIEMIFSDFIELKGDRYAGDDPALIGGIGFFDGRPVTVIGHQKGRNLKENLIRNYGMANPEGYRKALRLAREAETFGRPVITFIDTPGAYPGITAEERGIGEAIAKNLKEFSRLKVPVICIIIGEGGSGGALGIGVGDEVYMLENSVYSVITPEGCASILLRDASKAKIAAELMRMTAPDLLGFGIIDGIIPEGPGGAHESPEATAANIKGMLSERLEALTRKSTAKLLADRSQRLLAMGKLEETDRTRMKEMLHSFPGEKSGWLTRLFRRRKK
jgi:acetyl-CoA carboxylase carboxyl transferase subunit alpha